LAFGCSCLAFSFTWQFTTPWYAKVLTGSPVLILFGYLLALETIDLPTTFRCPLVPLIPSVGVLVNIYLISSLPIEAFYRVLVWTAIGLAIYFGYGIRNSALRFQLAAANAGFTQPDQVIVPASATSKDTDATEYRFGAGTAAYSINGDGTGLAVDAAIADPAEDYHSKYN
jgi:hypothetical protein